MIKFKTFEPSFAGRASFARSTLALSLSLSLLLCTTAPLKAADFTIIDGQTETNQTVTLVNGETGTIQAGGTIQDNADNAITASGTITIDNAGTLSSTGVSVGGTGGDGINFTGSSSNFLSLINRATGAITGNEDGVNGATITSLINSGTITGTTRDGVNAGTITSLTNSSAISGGRDGVNATTITSLTNTGTITVGRDGVRGATLTNITNSGTITAGQDGMEATTLTSLVNSGTITGVVNGVLAQTINSLTNSGTITGGTFAIRESTAADTLLTLLPGSNIFGAIDLGGGTNTLVIGDGLSIDHTFATLPTVTTNGALSASSGTRVVSVDISDLAFNARQDEVIFDLSSGIWGAVFSQLGDQGNSGGTSPVLSYAASSQSAPAVEAVFNDNRFRMWAKLFGSHRNQDGTASVASAKHNLGGMIIGLDSEFDSTINLGAFFGASKTEIKADTNQQESDVESFFGGLYGSFNSDDLTVHLGVTGGTTAHEGSRLVDNNQINGLQTVARTFDGTFLAPELSVSGQYGVGDTIVQPSLSVGYTGMFLDGYTETGSSAPLTVADRDLHLIHARFELAALLNAAGNDSDDYTYSPYLGIKGSSLVGGETVNATLLGQNVSFTPGGAKDIASIFAGVRVSVMQTNGFNVLADFEASYDTEQSSTVAGSLRFNWQF